MSLGIAKTTTESTESTENIVIIAVSRSETIMGTNQEIPLGIRKLLSRPIRALLPLPIKI